MHVIMSLIASIAGSLSTTDILAFSGVHRREVFHAVLAPPFFKRSSNPDLRSPAAGLRRLPPFSTR